MLKLQFSKRKLSENTFIWQHLSKGTWNEHCSRLENKINQSTIPKLDGGLCWIFSIRWFLLSLLNTNVNFQTGSNLLLSESGPSQTFSWFEQLQWALHHLYIFGYFSSCQHFSLYQHCVLHGCFLFVLQSQGKGNGKTPKKPQILSGFNQICIVRHVEIKKKNERKWQKNSFKKVKTQFWRLLLSVFAKLAQIQTSTFKLETEIECIAMRGAWVQKFYAVTSQIFNQTNNCDSIRYEWSNLLLSEAGPSQTLSWSEQLQFALHHAYISGYFSSCQHFSLYQHSLLHGWSSSFSQIPVSSPSQNIGKTQKYHGTLPQYFPPLPSEEEPKGMIFYVNVAIISHKISLILILRKYSRSIFLSLFFSVTVHAYWWLTIRYPKFTDEFWVQKRQRRSIQLNFQTCFNYWNFHCRRKLCFCYIVDWICSFTSCL